MLGGDGENRELQYPSASSYDGNLPKVSVELAEFSGGLRLHGDAARGTVKFDPMLHLHNIKALWNAVRFYVPRKLVRLRKLDQRRSLGALGRQVSQSIGRASSLKYAP
jgi:hypothetical protein